MHLVVDGIIYGLVRHGGINTLFNNVLLRLAAREGTGVDLFVPRVCAGEPPGAPVRKLRRELLPDRTGLSWKIDQLAGPLIRYVNSGIRAVRAHGRRGVVFQSTYFTPAPMGIPHVAIALDMNHEHFPDRYQEKFGVWLRRVYPKYLGDADRVVAISHATKEDVVRFYEIDEAVIDVVHLAVDPSTYYMDQEERHLGFLQEQFGISPPYLLYVGARCTAYKNFALLLRAFKLLARSSNLSLVVAGYGWSRDEAAEIETLGLTSSIRLVEHPSDDVLRVLYNFAHAFVFPSLNEGFGIPVLEAMACGTPVLAASTRVFREVAGDAALYFDPHDMASLVRAIESSFDENLRKEFRDRGLRRASQYSWDRCADDMYAVYQRALLTG